MAQNKIRLDTLLVELGYFESKEKARTCIMSNGVSIAGTLANKPGKQINAEKFYKEFEDNPEYLSVEDKMAQYVSRGAFKLKSAHEKFGIDFTNKVVLDIGASTGGFTDYSLQNGAKGVIALDVGKGQLHYKLQQDERVKNLEAVNFKEWDGVIASTKRQSMQDVDIVVIDTSFISLITILEKLYTLLCLAHNDKAIIIALIKPQFEAGKEIMDKCQGIIRDDKIRREVLERTLSQIKDLGFKLSPVIESPIKGAKGNIEYLVKLEC